MGRRVAEGTSRQLGWYRETAAKRYGTETLQVCDE